MLYATPHKLNGSQNIAVARVFTAEMSTFAIVTHNSRANWPETSKKPTYFLSIFIRIKEKLLSESVLVGGMVWNKWFFKTTQLRNVLGFFFGSLGPQTIFSFKKNPSKFE